MVRGTVTIFPTYAAYISEDSDLELVKSCVCPYSSMSEPNILRATLRESNLLRGQVVKSLNGSTLESETPEQKLCLFCFLFCTVLVSQHPLMQQSHCHSRLKAW